ncbi:MAG: hypothetical protein ACPGU1_05275 [Myxococcota bacterium]
MSTTSSSPRILALHAADRGPSLTLSRVIGVLSAQGVQVDAVALPISRGAALNAAPPTLAELKAGLHSLAESVGAALRGEDGQSTTEHLALEQALSVVTGPVDAVLVTDAHIAQHLFPLAAAKWPKALRIGLEGDFHVSAAWARADMDLLITPHPTLGAELPAIRDGRARLYAGGPVVPLEGPTRRLGDDIPNVVMSVSRLDPSEVDPLLFQLSLTDSERYHLLFLPSGRPSVDDLVRDRAAGYGLSGKRPRAGCDPEPWIRGAELLIGRPSPAESAAAAVASVPQVLFTTQGELSGGDAFLVQHGLALHAATALTVAVQVEQALPDGDGRAALIDALERFETDGATGAAGCVLRGLRDGRTAPTPPMTSISAVDDELEDIGQVAAPQRQSPLDERSRRAYLKEIILQQRDLKRQLDRARSGVDTWSHRRRLAQSAGDSRLEQEAKMRVEGIQKVMNRLVAQERAAQALREKFASGRSLSASDRSTAAQLMSSEATATINRLSRAAERGAFERLEIEDALDKLKRRMGEDD